MTNLIFQSPMHLMTSAKILFKEKLSNIDCLFKVTRDPITQVQTKVILHEMFITTSFQWSWIFTTEMAQMIPKELIVILACMAGILSSIMKAQLYINWKPIQEHHSHESKNVDKLRSCNTVIQSISIYIIKYNNTYKQMVSLTTIYVDSLSFKDTDIR